MTSTSSLWAALFREVDANAEARPRLLPRLERRAPAHVVYGGAHLYAEGTVEKVGALARRAFDTYGRDAGTFAAALALPPGTEDRTFERVRAKLLREPVEDYRIDFEDGYGVRSDAEEDEHAARAGRALARAAREGRAAPLSGVRVKSLAVATRLRAARTFDTFMTALLDEGGGSLPPGVVVTLPKVEGPAEVRVLSSRLDDLERASGLSSGAIGLELMVETPAIVLGPDGRSPLGEVVLAGAGRVTGVHIGSYDLTASLGIVGSAQRLEHPACDFAKHIVQFVLAGQGLALSDGATTVLPIEPHRGEPHRAEPLSAEARADNERAVHHAWRLHADAVRHGLIGGFFQGWDLHPAQVPARFGALFAFFAEALPEMRARLGRFRAQKEQATRVGQAFDDAATAEGLANFFRFGELVGALDPHESAA